MRLEMAGSLEIRIIIVFIPRVRHIKYPSLKLVRKQIHFSPRLRRRVPAAALTLRLLLAAAEALARSGDGEESKELQLTQLPMFI